MDRERSNRGARALRAQFVVPFEHEGLVPAVKRAVDKFRKDTGIHILLQCDEQVLFLPSNMELNAYRIVQEALTNIKKHANAYIVRVLLSYDADGYIRILIENDGKGFDQSQIHSSEGEHLGLTIMKERAKHLGGELKIESEPDEGTRVELRFRYKESSDDS